MISELFALFEIFTLKSICKDIGKFAGNLDDNDFIDCEEPESDEN